MSSEDWNLTLSYAAHAEFLCDEFTYAQLVFDFDDVTSDCLVMVYAYGVNVANVSGDTSLNWTVNGGVNKLSLYFSGSFSPEGSIRVYMRYMNGTSIPITNLGHYSGLAGVTSSTHTPRAFIFPEDIYIIGQTGLNISVDDDSLTGLVAMLTPQNSDDLTTDTVELNVPDLFDIYATPIFEVTVLTNDTAVMARLSIEVIQYNGIGTFIQTDWFNTTTDGWITLDLQRLAYEQIGGTGYGIFTRARNLTIIFADMANDGVALVQNATTYVGIGLRSRLAYIHNIKPRELPIEGLLGGFNVPTSKYNTTSQAIQGTRALLLGPSCMNVTYDMSSNLDAIDSKVCR
ncbi:hypothetical protein ES708_29080 [subsurface metagenome]